MKNRFSTLFSAFRQKISARFLKRTPRENPMFTQLRNHFVFITTAVSTIVLVTAFSTIYYVAENAGRRPFVPGGDLPKFGRTINATDDVAASINDFVHERIQNEREEAKKSLLISLIVIGVGVEISVIFLSYLLAEDAIRPVKNAYNAQKVFIANASHEIKTPLAALSANFEAADFPENQWTKNITHEIEILTALNHDLLELARAENLTKSEAKVKINLEKLLATIMENFSAQIAAKHIALEIRTQDLPTKTEISKAAFSEIATILLDNALKYCDQKIQISLNPHMFEIKNDGAKIAAEHLPHIFERFYQTDKNAAGVGLGLAIAKALADRENWKLTASCDKLVAFKLEF